MIRPVRPDGSIETGGTFVPIFRSRVVERIASAARQRIVLLIAPAGFGKSVAVSHYLERATVPWIRYDLLADNSGLLGFVRGFADAITAVAPDARTTLAGAYEKNVDSESPGANLAMWMHTHLRDYRGAIVIDDLHVAQDDREVTRFLTSLVDRSKDHISWVLSSRASTGLPIGTWLAYGDSDLAIDDHDLKFSLSEARDAARSFKLAVGDQELNELLNLTDGWATALSFALRSSTRSVDLRSVASMTRDMMYRYLAEQVYQSFSDVELKFIETAALLPRVDIPTMIEAGFDRAAAIMDGLRGRAAFISAEDANVFRLHDLFKDYVLHELSLRGAEAANKHIDYVASVVERLGQQWVALRLYGQSGNASEVLRLVREVGVMLIDHGYVDDVRAATAALDESAIDSDVRGVLGLLQLAAGKYDHGERLLAGAIPGIRDADLRAELVLRFSVHLLNRGRDVREIVKDLAANDDVPERYRLEAQATMASSSARTGAHGDARAFIDQIVPRLDHITDEALAARILLRLGVAASIVKTSAEARGFLERAADLAARQGEWATSSRAHRVLSRLAHASETESAMILWHAQQASTAAARAGNYYDVQMSYLMMLHVETQRGNAEEAENIERRLAELGKADAVVSPYLLTSQAHRAAWRGRFAESQRTFRTVRGRAAFAEDEALVSACYSLCLAMDSALDESSSASSEALQQIATADKQSVTVEIASIIVCAADILCGRLTVVRRTLPRLRKSRHDVTKLMLRAAEELLAMAENATYTSSEIHVHLNAVAGQGFGGYGKYLEVAAVEIERRRVPDEAVRLTPSEVRILRALAEGRTPKQIAAEMNRSTLTVQTHIQNVAKKLGGHSRADTIAVARQLGLL